MIRYSITDLEKLSGIKAHTIRIWEKRYNIVSPKRTKTNIRYYNDDDLKKILNISTLNRYGFKISRIACMDDSTIKEKVREISGTHGDNESLINSFVVSMIEMDDEAFIHNFNTAVLKLGFEECITKVVYPFLEKMGVLWMTGTINPAQEHFITNIIRQKLIVAIDAQPEPNGPGTKSFLLFLPEQELHELGLLFYYYLLKKNGFRVIYLGQSVPFEDVIKVTNIRKADYLLTYFITALKQKDINPYLKRLSETLPEKKIFITGIQLAGDDLSLPPNVSKVNNAGEFRQTMDSLK